MAVLLSEEKDGVCILTLNRPEVRNAISSELANAIGDALAAIGERRDIRVVILTGAGDKAFSAGTDLKERRGLDAAGKWAQAGALRRANSVIWALPQPVIAAVQGFCLGGGFELASTCDIRIAAQSAVFSWPEMKLGAYPGGNGGVMFPKLVGLARAKELFLTARDVKAEEALGLGIVQQLVPDGEHLKAAISMAQQICRNSSPLGAAAIKRMVNDGATMRVEEALGLNDRLRRPLEDTNDYQEGIRAFFEKRTPVWTGS